MESNPYLVLRLQRGASEAEILKAYQILASKYCLKDFKNSPLYEFAKEKMHEITVAFKKLMNPEKEVDPSNCMTSDSILKNTGTNEFYTQIRTHIIHNQLGLADEMLENQDSRDAEWNYLKGIVLLYKGWYDKALSHVELAVRVEPENGEYNNLLQDLISRPTESRKSRKKSHMMDDCCKGCDCCECVACDHCHCPCSDGCDCNCCDGCGCDC
ncbi:MAG: J domain-containing protein [Clostridia bacterium]|nr:J domain-containing protein [Clostridia bacterium]